MEEDTYRDPQGRSVINKQYISVRVDQDARPDLSRRYEDFGWPATIVFNPKEEEIVNRRGYISPRSHGKSLEAVIDDPSPVADTPE